MDDLDIKRAINILEYLKEGQEHAEVFYSKNEIQKEINAVIKILSEKLGDEDIENHVPRID